MKKLLNTLMVTTEGVYLHKSRETVVVKLKQESMLQLPLNALSNIYCFGRVSVSPHLMAYCAASNIGIAFFSYYGKFQAIVLGEQQGNVLLRKQQYRWSDSEQQSLDISRFIVGAKIANSRKVLQRHLRNRLEQAEEADTVQKAIDEMWWSLNSVRTSNELNVLRGVEGDAANSYFRAVKHLVVQQKEDFRFESRKRRPPTDPINALLSFVYAIMLQDCVSALLGVGLDPYVGFLHRDRPGRQSLALDILEEFRSFVGDRLVLSLINLKQVRRSDFRFEENGAVLLGDKVKKIVLTEYQRRKQQKLIHPVVKEKVAIGMLFHVQAMLMARYIRGDIECYPAFLWR